MYIKELKIGNIVLENNLILGPMAGITDLPFRNICKKYGGPGLVCNEMVSAKAISYDDKKTNLMLNTTEFEKPISMQIFGKDPVFMGIAAKKISMICDILDINMGCPAPKVVRNGDGSKLLLDLELVQDIIQEVVKNSEKPVTVKIRKGWDNQNIVAVDVAQIAEKAGASAVIVHGRTREEYYSGVADWDIIKRVKESVRIPVIGNGDIKTEEDAKRIFDETNVDGIMIGRASLGNPWIFKQMKYFLETGEKLEEVSIEEKEKVIKEHFQMLLNEKGEYVATREIRKHISWYVKGLKNASAFRDKINKVETSELFFEYLEEYFKSL